MGAQELLIIAVLIVIVIFAGPRLPKLGRSMGQSIRGFKKGLQDDAPLDDEDEKPEKLDAPSIKDDRDKT